MDALEFGGMIEFTSFLDWLDKMDEFFEWYNISDAQWISMTMMVKEKIMAGLRGRKRGR